MIQGQHRVGFAATEIGLKLDNRVAVIVGEAPYAVDQEPPQAAGQKGATENSVGILVFGDPAPQVDLPEVSCELSLLILAAGHVLMRTYHLPPRWQPTRRLVVRQRVGGPAPLGAGLLVETQPEQFHFHCFNVGSLR